ncbi:MAG: aspartate aminotransferase family protein [Microthrixaceae bacterium]|nr:aspartate aminotransferase family protein [Microthrixaceae bacterium]
MRPPFDDRAELVEAFARHVNRGKVATYEQLGLDIVMGERSGSWFHDAFEPSRRWLNCHCNGGVFNLGHRNPTVVTAVREGLDHLDVGNHHLVSGWRAELARRLAASSGGRLPGVVFGVSGGEAVDLALKVARAHTGRQGIVSAAGGYHGHTGLAMAAGDPQYRDAFGLNPPEFSQVPFGDLDAMAAAIDDETAAVILETIPATLGMPLPPPGYLREVSARCRDAGTLLILDEVQTGLGRCGAMWCHTQEDVEPDVVVTGKGLSGGVMPITATLMTEEVHSFFDDHPFVHISTFGGAELSCVAALAVLDILEAPGFLARVEHVGARLESALAGSCVEVRRRGMFMGLRFEDPAGGLVATQQLIGAGVFAIFANNDPSVLQFLPPLTITDDELEWLTTTTLEALGAT